MRDKGFTLIEIIIVIIAVLVITLVSLRWITKKSNVQAQANQLAADIRFIQNKAVTSAARYRITFSSNQYTFTDISDNPVVHPGVAGSNTITLDSGIVLTYNSAILPNGYIVFNSRGAPFSNTATAELSGDAEITLKGGVDSKIVTVTPETGRVSVN